MELLGELEATEIVVGIPLRMDGSEGEMAEEARRFGQAVQEQSGIPVFEWDERITTAGAQRELRAIVPSRRRREEKGVVDRMAAALLLRSYLEAR